MSVRMHPAVSDIGTPHAEVLRLDRILCETHAVICLLKSDCWFDFVPAGRRPSGRRPSGRTHISPCQLGEDQQDECQLDEDHLDELIIIPK